MIIYGGSANFFYKGPHSKYLGLSLQPYTPSVTSVLAKRTSGAVFQYSFIYGRCNVMFTYHEIFRYFSFGFPNH